LDPVAGAAPTVVEPQLAPLADVAVTVVPAVAGEPLFVTEP
jgi:hypothetical protein